MEKSCLQNNTLYINNTYRSTYHACTRKFLLARICRLAPKYGSNALRYGSTWHGFLEGYYKHIQENGWKNRDVAVNAAVKEGKKMWDSESSSQIFNEDYRTYENACLSFTQYLSTFPTDANQIQVLHTEKNFTVPIGTVVAMGRTIDVIYYGKLDLGIKFGGVNWLVDHKTTGASIDYMADRLKRSAQLIGYSWAGKSFDFHVEGMMVFFHQLTSRKKKDGNWGKTTIDFRRVPHIFNDYDLLEWEDTLLTTAGKMAESIITGHYQQEYDSCYQFGQCPYSRICEQDIPVKELIDGLVPVDYVVKPRQESYEKEAV